MKDLPYSQSLKSNFTSELRWSENMQLGFLLSGSLRIRHTNHVREYLMHDIFFFLPFESWSVIQEDSDTMVFMLEIEPDFLKTTCPDIKRLYLQRHHLTADLTNTIYRKACRYYSSIVFNDLKKELCSDMKVLSAVTNLITLIFETYGITKDEIAAKDYNEERTVRILSYLEEHYTEKISVSDIASHVGLHPQYFSTFFKNRFGVKFIDYLTTFRINSSLPDLLRTDHSILEVAIDHGFSNHKTYATAFRKLYGCSPTEYRKSDSSRPSALSSQTEDIDPKTGLGVFSYFRQFIKDDNEFVPASHTATERTLEFTPRTMKKQGDIRNRLSLSAGRALAVLRSNLREQILKARLDFNLTYLRIRDIFSDSLYIYYENSAGEPIFSFQNLDEVFDFLVDNGITPFPEIGYMPERLASKKQYAGYLYRPNVSAPKSVSIWKELIRSFLTHYLERYGAENLHNWYFDFWVSPDLKMKLAYWYGSMEEFFEFYAATWQVFHEVDPELKLGTPNFSSLSGFPWYDSFFRYAASCGIKPAYVSVHLYGSEARDPSPSNESLEQVDSRRFSVSDPQSMIENLHFLREIMGNNGFSELPLVISDMNLSFLPRDLVRETCYMGPWLCYNFVQSLDLAQEISFWAISDIHEETFPENTLFYGGPGAMDYRGLKKAAYNTLTLITKLKGKILDKGDYYILTEHEGSYQLLLFNLIEFDEMYARIDNTVIDRTHRYNIYRNDGSLLVHLLLHVTAGSYLIKKREVNRNYGSAYDIWAGIGFPEDLRDDVEEYIRTSSVPRLTFTTQDVNEALILDEIVPAHGVVLLEIERFTKAENLTQTSRRSVLKPIPHTSSSS